MTTTTTDSNNEGPIESKFWNATDILLKKPHVVNKRLWGCKILYRCGCKIKTENWYVPSNFKGVELVGKLEDHKTNILQELDLMVDESDAPDIEIILQELFPKIYTDNHALQLIIMDRRNTELKFFDNTPAYKEQNLCPNFSYTIKLVNNEITLESECPSSKSHEWLNDVVLPQIIKWANEKKEQGQHICSESLVLISGEEYYEKYNQLKLKHGREMVKIWPECTDPSKFVYEDIAIATYLLLLWENERNHLNLTTPQTFVDLGCGNGLLVYILIKEGHVGVGVDLRKRKIWDMYTQDIKLEERTITPSDNHLFPEADWIIGNHSDELTPWIPVIAARSSYKCNFFLLPCCAYNFDGSKYRRHDSSISQYSEYLQYVKQLCEKCGFNTDLDRLKIPSTKRICLIGRGRIFPEKEYNTYCRHIQNIINNETVTTEKNTSLWVKDFKTREPKEKVRNCTHVEKAHANSIVKIISNYLLDGCSVESTWSIGKTVELNKVVQLIPHDDLLALKSECGGLQTLLRNNHQIFKVHGGKVQLRYPKSIEEVNSSNSNKNKISKIKLQQKPCWFYNNHPQGCPLKDSDCSFIHSVV